MSIKWSGVAFISFNVTLRLPTRRDRADYLSSGSLGPSLFLVRYCLSSVSLC